MSITQKLRPPAKGYYTISRDARPDHLPAQPRRLHVMTKGELPRLVKQDCTIKAQTIDRVDPAPPVRHDYTFVTGSVTQCTLKQEGVVYFAMSDFYRGLSEALNFWPNRVIILGDQSSDAAKLRSDWGRVRSDLKRASRATLRGVRDKR